MLRIWERNSSILRRRIRIAANTSIRSSKAGGVHDEGCWGDLVVPHDGKELPSFEEWDWEEKPLGQHHDEELPNLENSKGSTRDSVGIVCCRGIWHVGLGGWKIE